MGREPFFDLLLLMGVGLLAWRLRGEHRVSTATILFLPAIMVTFVLLQRALVVETAGFLGVPAALAGVLAGLVVATRSWVRVEPSTGAIVVRGTPLSLLLWPGSIALYILGRRAFTWLREGVALERLDGAFLVFLVALLLTERGWLYSASRNAVMPAQQRLR